MVAIGSLATGGDAVVAGRAEPAATRSAAPPDLADRGADRASRDGRTATRTGTVPSPNSATRAKPRPPQPSWVRPVKRYRMTSGFGPRWGTMHAGVDLAGPTGTPIMAVRAGTVTQAGWYGGYGYAVIIDHGNGVSTLYGHNSRVLVRKGQRVGTGQRVSLMGSTGHSTGPHLHLEVHLGEEPVNPVPWLRTRGVRL